MRSRLVFALAAVSWVGAWAACSRKVDEPTPTNANPPSPTSPSSTSTTSASIPYPGPSSSTMTPTIYPPAASDSNEPDPKAPFGPKEFKEFKMKISNEDCEKAAAKKNKLEGLPEFDKKGSLLIWPCLREGNVAWYRCVLTADKIENFNWCSRRYLITPEEVKLQPQ